MLRKHQFYLRKLIHRNNEYLNKSETDSLGILAVPMWRYTFHDKAMHGLKCLKII